LNQCKPKLPNRAQFRWTQVVTPLALLVLLGNSWGCSQAPGPDADVIATRESTTEPAGREAPDAVGEPTVAPSPFQPDSVHVDRARLEVPRTSTPANASFPAASRVIQAWEQVYYSTLDLETDEPDSALFFRYQAMLTHLDPGMIEPGAVELRERAVELRHWISRSRDDAWQRWQVDLKPPPEPGTVTEATQAAIVPADHPRVDKWIQIFTGPSRERFATWIWRSGAYRPLMERILVEEGVPKELIAMVFVESGFSLVAKSKASAVGPWQFIRDTGRRYNLTINNHRDERRDFVLATHAAARYLHDLYDYFGDWNLAMAAYNCGEGRVFRQISRQGTNDFWALDLPRETEDYVPEIHAALKILADPEAYGFSTEIDQPLDFVEHPLPGPIRVADLAQHCALSVDAVKALNPSWLRAVTPADGKPVTARIPRAISPTISLASLPLAPASETVARGGTHKVRKGETLSGIARKNGVSLTALARENGLTTKSKIRAGRVLQLPDGASGTASRSETVRKKSTTGKKAPSTVGKSKSAASVHTVRRGDTLSEICARYGVRLNDVKRWNNLGSSSIRAGQRLKIAG